MRELDRLADEAGGYLAPYSPENNKIGYDYRAIIKYSREKGIEPINLTPEELEQFRTR